MPTPAGEPTINELSLIWEHQSRLTSVEATLKQLKDQSEAISVVITKLDFIAQTIKEIKDFQKEVESRVTDTEKEMASQKERTNNLAVFQSALSIFIGAAVAFLKPK